MKRPHLRNGLLALSALALMSVAACDRPRSPDAPKPPSGTPPSPSSGASPSAPSSAGAPPPPSSPSSSPSSSAPSSGGSDQLARAGGALDDAAITAKVKAGILAEPELKVLKIDVDTKEGRVTLTGSADNAELVKKAEQVASAVEGVKGVDNRLSVSKS